jgi:hypothetical protein
MREGRSKASEQMIEPRDLPFVQEALASIAEGGFAEALARVACLLARKGEPLLLSRLQMRQELKADYQALLPAMPPDQWRRIRGEQEIIVRYEPEQALATLPKLLARRGDRDKLVTLVRRLPPTTGFSVPAVDRAACHGQHIGETLEVPSGASRRSRVPRKSSGKKPTTARLKESR